MENLTTPHETRRDNVDACLIRLADNQLWGFAKPSARLVPVIKRYPDQFGRVAEVITARSEITYPCDVRIFLEKLGPANTECENKEKYILFIILSVRLLLLVHEIGEETARSLLSVKRSEISRLVYEVLSVATIQ